MTRDGSAVASYNNMNRGLQPGANLLIVLETYEYIFIFERLKKL